MHCVFSTVSECMVFLIYEPLLTNYNINVSNWMNTICIYQKGGKIKKAVHGTKKE